MEADFSIKFAPEINREQAEAVVKALDDYYKACGGQGFEVIWKETQPNNFVEYLQVQNPEDGIVLRSKGSISTESGGWSTLECLECGAFFHWPVEVEDRSLPNRRHLNHCPGCGKTITGFEIPANH